MRDYWFDIKKITNEIYAIYDSYNTPNYLINGTKKSLLIDSGWGLSNIKKFAEKYTTKPIILVNTHGHPDHVGGNSDFCEFYISKFDIDRLKKSYNFKNRKWTIENMIKKYPADFSESEWINKKLNTIIPIEDGYEFDLGDKIIEIIHTPGHSKGSVVLLDRVSRYIFSGDMVVNGVWLHLEESESILVYKESLQKIKKKESYFDYILPGHGEKMDISILNNLISLSENISKKRIHGKKIQTRVGEGIKYSNGNCKIISKIG